MCVARHLPPLKPSKPGCCVKDIDTATLLELCKLLPARAIMPQYDLASLQWLVTMAEQSESEGTLAKRCVETINGQNARIHSSIIATVMDLVGSFSWQHFRGRWKPCLTV